MKRSLGRSGLAAAILFLASAGIQADTPYAPVLDSTTASDNQFLLFRLKGAEENLPDASDVPVPPYRGSSIFAILDISSVSDSSYQKNGTEVMLEKGAQLFWGGNTFLEAPRVEILDVSGETPASTGSPEIPKLKESFPQVSTVIKVYYEKSVEDLMSVDTEIVVAGCIAHEVESKGKLMGANMEDQAAKEYLQNMARSSCAKVGKACKKDTNGRQCQRYARLYK